MQSMAQNTGGDVLCLWLHPMLPVQGHNAAAPQSCDTKEILSVCLAEVPASKQIGHQSLEAWRSGAHDQVKTERSEGNTAVVSWRGARGRAANAGRCLTCTASQSTEHCRFRVCTHAGPCVQAHTHIHTSHCAKASECNLT